MLKFFYFDLGNVLVRFDHDLACRQMGEVAGLPPEVVRQAIFDEGVQWRYERGEITCREFHELFCRRTQTQGDFQKIRAAASAIFEINAPVTPIVASLAAAGHRLGVLSNTCAAHWEYCLPRYSILRFFDVFALSYELRSMKPEEAIYLAAAEQAHTPPEQIFFTDDRPENVEGAKRAGFDAVLFTTARRLAAELRPRGVEFNY